MNWYVAESTERPLEVDQNLSKEYVYLRKDITEEIREDVTYYVYKECKISKEYYDIYDESQQVKANIDYLAMMLDIDL